MSEFDPRYEPGLTDLFRQIWRARLFILAGIATGFLLAGITVISAVPQYKATMIVGPANPMDGAEMSSLLANDNLFALRYLVQRVSSSQSTEFLTFENIFNGPSVADILAKDAQTLGMLTRDRRFHFQQGARQWSAPKVHDYLRAQVNISPVGGSPLRELFYAHPDPEFAQHFLTLVHGITDSLIRGQIARETTARILYLKDAISATQNPDHRRALTTLLMEQERLKMLVSLEEPYAASVIEPAAIAARPVWPDGYLIFGGLMFLGAAAGFMFHRTRRRADPYDADF